jgi:hypothetical protein
MTPFSYALQVFSASLRKPARRSGYRGLKIFTSLALHFQVFSNITICIQRHEQNHFCRSVIEPHDMFVALIYSFAKLENIIAR